MRNLFLVIALAIPYFGAGQTGNTCIDAIPTTPLTTCFFYSYTTSSAEMWFEFTANSTFVNIELSQGIFGHDSAHIHNMALLTGSCGSLTLLAEDELSFAPEADVLSIDLNATGIVIGSTYYIRLMRTGTNTPCDKTECMANGSTNAAKFNMCVEQVDLIIPLDLQAEPASGSHSYERNRGQLADVNGAIVKEVLYYTTQATPAVYIAKDKTSFVYSKIDTDSATVDTMHRVDMALVGGNPNARVFRMGELPGVKNYYLAHVPKGVTQNHAYDRVVCHDVYPRVDVQFYSNEVGLKMYFVVRPEGDADDLKLKFSGATSANVSGSGGLVIETLLGDLEFERAHVYRINPGGNIVPMPASGDFVQVSPDVYSFDIQNYPSSMPLIIVVDKGHAAAPGGNPLPQWSTFFGGTKEDFVNDIVTDDIGDLYVVGHTASLSTGSNPFPAQGPFVLPYQGSVDAFSGSFQNTTYVPKWITYLGGVEGDFGYGLTYSRHTDEAVFISGVSNSPVTSVFTVPLTPSSYVESSSSTLNRAFVARFDPLDGLLEWSTCFGRGRTEGRKITSDGAGNVYLTGQTSKFETTQTCTPPVASEFPICNPGGGAFTDASHNPFGTFQYDGFIAKFNPSAELVWSTYFGGIADEFVSNVTFDVNQNKLYVVGSTSSAGNLAATCSGFGPGFALCNAGGYFQPNVNGIGSGLNNDAFVMRFNQNGVMEWSTFFGGFGDDGATGVAVNSLGDVFITGYTSTSTYGADCSVPTNQGFPHCSAGGYNQSGNAGSFDNFVAKFDLNTNLRWSTFLGGSLAESTEQVGAGPQITVNSDHRVFVYSTSRSGSVLGSSPFISMPATGLYNEANHADMGGVADNTDTHIMGFEPNGQLFWSTYFGGKGFKANTSPRRGDVSGGVATFQNDNIFICGGSYSTQDFALNCPPNVNTYCQGYTTVSPDYQDGFIAQVALSQNVGIETEAFSGNEFLVYPNPSTGLYSVKWSSETSSPVTIDITSVVGQLIKRIECAKELDQASFDLSNFSDGLYCVTLKFENSQKSQLIIKR